MGVDPQSPTEIRERRDIVKIECTRLGLTLNRSFDAFDETRMTRVLRGVTLELQSTIGKWWDIELSRDVVRAICLDKVRNDNTKKRRKTKLAQATISGAGHEAMGIPAPAPTPAYKQGMNTDLKPSLPPPPMARPSAAGGLTLPLRRLPESLPHNPLKQPKITSDLTIHVEGHRSFQLESDGTFSEFIDVVAQKVCLGANGDIRYQTKPKDGESVELKGMSMGGYAGLKEGSRDDETAERLVDLGQGPLVAHPNVFI